MEVYLVTILSIHADSFNIDRRFEISLGHSLLIIEHKELEARRDHLINRNKLIHICFLGEEIWVGKQKESLRTHCLSLLKQHITSLSDEDTYLPKHPEWVHAGHVASPKSLTLELTLPGAPRGCLTGKCGHSGSLWGAWSWDVGDTFTDHKNIKHTLTSVTAYLYCLSSALGEALQGGWRSFGLGGQVLL